MWANTVWGFFGLSVTFGLARLTMPWPDGYQWLAPWLTGVSGLSFLVAFIVLLWPYVFAKKVGAAPIGNNMGTIQNNSGIITQGQFGGINMLTVNQEDRSPKRRLRDLFNSIDTRIVPKVAAGERQLIVRMQPFDIDRLNMMIKEVGNPPIVFVTGFGRRMTNSHIANGTLGPSFAVEDQTEVHLLFQITSLG